MERVDRDLAENYSIAFNGRVGFGRRPAIVVIDFVKAYTEQGSPLFAPGVIAAAVNTASLLTIARRRSVPIVFTRVQYHPNGIDGGFFVRKVPCLSGFTAGQRIGEFADEITVQESDLVITKNYPSAFFGTTLASTLHAAEIDTLIVTGCTTSGCVRATAIDGLQHGYRVIVPDGCVGDRHPAPHEANLFDIDAKYGDVVTTAAAIRYVEAL